MIDDGVLRICLDQGPEGYLCNRPYGHQDPHGWSDHTWEREVVNRFRVWHIPQVPMQPFYVYCTTAREAVKFQEVLAFYDLFQLEYSIKPDFSNASGIEEYDGSHWTEVDEDDLPEN